MLHAPEPLAHQNGLCQYNVLQAYDVQLREGLIIALCTKYTN